MEQHFLMPELGPGDEANLAEERRLRKKKYDRDYNQKPEVKQRKKEYHKDYNQKPEVKERRKDYHKDYNQKPEVKQRKKEYHQRPEVKERQKEQKKERYENNKEIAIAMKGGKCFVTGVSAIDEDLEFAHVVRDGSKEWNIPTFYNYIDMINDPKFLKEINKVELMTKQCHKDYDSVWFRTFGNPQTEKTFPYFVAHYRSYIADDSYENYKSYYRDNPLVVKYKVTAIRESI